MEGRWTINQDPTARGWLASIRGPFTQHTVPVVPCDDAAVERVVSVLGFYMPGRTRDFIHRAAAAAFEAAGDADA